MKTIVTADITCDLNAELRKKYDVRMIPYHIVLGDETYKDNIDITLDEVFDRYAKDETLPKTGAISLQEYEDFFTSVKDEIGEDIEIVHVTLGSALTSSFENCELIAEKLGWVYPVDSCTLSSATGLVVMDAYNLVQEGKCAKEIQEYLQERCEHAYHASFVIDTLEFLAAGGRCSSLVALASAALSLKPAIIVDNKEHGAMKVGKKYRGKLDKVIAKYVHDELNQYDNIDYKDVMITCSVPIKGMDEYGIIREILENEYSFENIHETQASCTIGSHCGPGTIGVLFRTK